MYTRKEKNQMDEILAAFAGYVSKHSYFDLVYSKKIGYIRIVIEEDSDTMYTVVEGAEDLLKTLYDDMVMDELQKQIEKYGEEDASKVNYDKIRAKVNRYLRSYRGDRQYALDVLEDCITDWQERE